MLTPDEAVELVGHAVGGRLFAVFHGGGALAEVDTSGQLAHDHKIDTAADDVGA